jgi:hypothetical protein
MPDLAAPDKPRRGRKPGQKVEKPKPPTARSMSRELKVMAMTSLGFVGGVKYLERVAKTNPAAYLSFLAKTLVMRDDHEGDGEKRYVVQQIAIVPVPTAGVINSPVAGHIAREHVRLPANAEVIENEAQGNG